MIGNLKKETVLWIRIHYENRHQGRQAEEKQNPNSSYFDEFLVVGIGVEVTLVNIERNQCSPRVQHGVDAGKYRAEYTCCNQPDKPETDGRNQVAK